VRERVGDDGRFGCVARRAVGYVVVVVVVVVGV